MTWLRALTRRFWIGPTSLLTRYAEELRRAPATGGGRLGVKGLRDSALVYVLFRLEKN